MLPSLFSLGVHVIHTFATSAQFLSAGKEHLITAPGSCCDIPSKVAWQGTKILNDAERLLQDPTFRLIGSE